jgi:pimeloyl-[acyl-carrier protein] methyl ester esterase
MKSALVLLHGWGAHNRVWDELAVRLDKDLNKDLTVIAADWPVHDAAPCSIERTVDQLAAAAPAQCLVAGWSLGGQLALAWARRYPQQVKRLILIAATPRFVSAADWSHGMAPEVFAEFSASLARDAAATLRRFLLLQTQGDAQVRKVARQLEAALVLQAQPDSRVLIETLCWLETSDLRATLPEITQPTLVIHGERDRITPPAAAEYLAAQLPHARLVLLGGAAHVPFMSDPDATCRLMTDFCNE